MLIRSVEPTLKISPEIAAAVHQPLERADRVLDVAEGARLAAVAVHLERLAGERALRRSAGSPSRSWPLCRGPTVLKSRAITQSSPRSWW